MHPITRAIGAVRLSRLVDETTSPERQREAITASAKAHGYDLVTVTEDLDVSGAVNPWRRDLAPWLSDNPPQPWDTLIVHKLDRLTRSLLDFQNLVIWLREHGKSLVSVSESIDLSTPAGRMIANVLVMFAEFERERIGERRREAALKLKALNRWGGGTPVFGYKPERRADGWYLVPDKDTARIARRMAGDLINGKSYNAIANWLDSEHVQPARAGQWSEVTVRKILRSPQMAGLLPQDDYSKLRLAVRDREVTRSPAVNGQHELLHVAWCIRCKASGAESPLYGMKRSGNREPVYRCKQCNMTVRKSVLEAKVEAELRGRWGSRKHRIRSVIPGDDNSREIARLERQLAEAKLIEFVDVSPLEAKIAELRAAPHEPDREVFTETGLTIAEHWDALTSASERNAFLRDNGVSCYADRRLFLMAATWFARWE